MNKYFIYTYFDPYQGRIWEVRKSYFIFFSFYVACYFEKLHAIRVMQNLNKKSRK